MFCYASAVSQKSNIKIYTHNCEKIDGVRKKSGENKNARKFYRYFFFHIFKISPPLYMEYKTQTDHPPLPIFFSFFLCCFFLPTNVKLFILTVKDY